MPPPYPTEPRAVLEEPARLPSETVVTKSGAQRRGSCFVKTRPAGSKAALAADRADPAPSFAAPWHSDLLKTTANWHRERGTRFGNLLAVFRREKSSQGTPRSSLPRRR